MTDVAITRALISVSDKTGLTQLAQSLANADVEMVSTGSTAQSIRDAGYDVTDVSSVTSRRNSRRSALGLAPRPARAARY